ncbi:MAG: FecR family protein [Bacteroidota bacterium]
MGGGLGGSLPGLMKEVVATQRQSLALRNVLAQVRSRPPLKRRSFIVRWSERMPRFRFVLSTLAAVGALAVWWSLQPAPLTFAVDAASGGVGQVGKLGKVGQTLQAPEASPDGRLPLRFSDGSQVTLERGARAQVTALDGRGATLRIDKGRAEVSVRHRRQTHWSLQAGSFEVTVTGTRFSIDWQDQSETLTVVMAEGTVEVTGRHLVNGSPIVVAAGQRFHATAREPRWTLASAGGVDPADPTPAPAATVADAPSTPPPAASPSESPAVPVAQALRGGGSPSTARSWQALARAGRYQEALQVVERTGFARACTRLGAEDLVQLGDAARLARNAGRAEQAYRMARKRFPAADRPAFALGLVAFEQRQDFRGAARWFDLYARKYPNGPLATEAVGREMESWHRAGDAGRARRVARAYLDQAPTGPYAPLARQIAAP